MREMDTTLWDLTKNSKIRKAHAKYRESMLPQKFVDANKAKILTIVDHDAKHKNVQLACPPSQKYPGNGSLSLTDGNLGPETHSSRFWLGFEGNDLEAIVELDASVLVKDLGVHCLQIPRIGIFLPSEVEFAVSENGKDFVTVATATHTVPAKEAGPLTKTLTVEGLDKTATFVRVRARNLGTIPRWHRSAGRKSWLFVDEIIVNQKSN